MLLFISKSITLTDKDFVTFISSNWGCIVYSSDFKPEISFFTVFYFFKFKVFEIFLKCYNYYIDITVYYAKYIIKTFLTYFYQVCQELDPV